MTIAEIEPLVPASVSKYFGEHNYNVVDNPKVKVHIDDARHFLLTTDQRFDAITSDPLDPWVKGAATLYSREFFELVKSRLNPGGVVTLFVQLYESNEAAVKSEIGTFMKAFPNSVVWGNTNNGVGYDLVLMGQLEPIKIDVDALQAKLDDPRYAQVAQSLREIGISSAVDLLSNYAGTPDGSGAVAGGRDDQHRSQPAAAVPGRDGVEPVPERTDLREHAAARAVSGTMFTGKPETMHVLRAAIAA